MSTTTSAASANCTGNIWVLPTQDAACALPNTGDYSSIMDQCCSPAEVRSYNDDCGLYCLAQGQSVGDLSSCLRDKGAKDGDFFCNANTTATATASATSTSATGDKTATATDSKASPTNSDNAAVSLSQPVSKSGLGLLAMLFCSALMGVVA